MNNKQLTIPIALDEEKGNFVSFKEIYENALTVLFFEQLSPDQKIKLVISRIEQFPEFAISILGIGKIDQKRAISEIQNKTSIGRTLLDIEERMIKRIMKKRMEDKTTKTTNET